MVKSLYEGRLAVDIAGLKMATPVTTGSGTFGFGLEFTDFLDLEKVGAVCVKGTSLLPSAGNKGQRAVETPSGMLNCIGLENPGSDYFLEHTLPELRKYDVPVIVNIYGHSPEEYGEVAKKLNVDGVDAVEINISCPNVKEGGIVFGTCPDAAAEVVAQVKANSEKMVITKLSPNVTDIVSMAKAVEEPGHRYQDPPSIAGQYHRWLEWPCRAPCGGAPCLSGGTGCEGAHYWYGWHHVR